MDEPHSIDNYWDNFDPEVVDERHESAMADLTAQYKTAMEKYRAGIDTENSWETAREILAKILDLHK